jgi:hypothetical protein
MESNKRKEYEQILTDRGAAEASNQARTKGTFWQRCTLNFLGDRTNYKAKDITRKNYKFILYLPSSNR